jgi:3-hydroxyisobutyrate dehydrogenase-like beta-hydroxyacid dehydrogenase
MSTVGPDHVLEVAARLPDGVELVDAPVLGGVANATDGTLQIFVGASQASFARCRELLAPMGTPIHLGPTGAGAAMKLVANSTLAGLMGLVGEALALADGFDLDQQRVIAALLDSPIGPALSRKLDKIQSDHYVPSFKLSLMRKDLGLVLDAAQRRSVELKLVQDAAWWIEQAERQGLGGYDYSAVVAQIRGRTATG